MKNKNNYYDNISVDIDKLFDECSEVRKRKRKKFNFEAFYKISFSFTNKTSTL